MGVWKCKNNLYLIWDAKKVVQTMSICIDDSCYFFGAFYLNRPVLRFLISIFVFSSPVTAHIIFLVVTFLVKLTYPILGIHINIAYLAF